MSDRYDVIIVGAGPAGGLLAYLLARQNLRVLVLEKEALPRYKPCGGGLTRRALNLLPFSIEPVIEDQTFRPRILVCGRTVFQAQSDEPAVMMVSRDRFDQHVLQQALDAGADVAEQCTFRTISGSIGDLTIETSRGIFKSKYLAAADGVNSRMARAMGLSGPTKFMAAIEGEIYPTDPGVIDGFRGSADFDFGPLPAGYGWVFPKGDHLSAGVLTRHLSIKHLKPFYRAYLTSKGINPEDTRSLRPHLIPYGRTAGSSVANDQGLVLGDAAGWTDPITGEGIYFAFKTAHMAANTIQAALNGPQGLSEYSTGFGREIVTDLVYAKRLAWLLYECPRLSHWILQRHGQGFGRIFVDIIQGRQTYRELYLKMLKDCLNPVRLVRILNNPD